MVLITPPIYEGLSGVITLFHNVYKRSFDKYIVATPSSTNSFTGRVGANDLISRDIPIKSHWCSQGAPNSSVIITLKKHFLKLSNYTMRSREDSVQTMPTNWLIEASNDFEEWNFIKEEGPNNDLVKINVQKMYESPSDRFYKHFRFTQIKGTYFCFAKIELFGELTGAVAKECSIHYKRSLSKFVFSLFLIC